MLEGVERAAAPPSFLVQHEHEYDDIDLASTGIVRLVQAMRLETVWQGEWVEPGWRRTLHCQEHLE